MILLRPIMEAAYPGDGFWSARVQEAGDSLSTVLESVSRLNDGQYAALASLVEGIGLPAFTGSALNRLINAGNDARAVYEFEKFVYGPDPVTGLTVVLPALIYRRQQEKAVWLS